MTADDGPRTRRERWQRGRAERERMPLAAHAELTPAADQDGVALLMSQSLTRVPELVPLRYGRMLVSPFAFYRGRGVDHGRRSRARTPEHPDQPAVW